MAYFADRMQESGDSRVISGAVALWMEGTYVKRAVILSLAALAATSWVSACLAENEPVNIVTGTAVVDGKLDEFVKAGALVCYMLGPDFLGSTSGIDSAADQSGNVYVMYDAKNLYWGADVTDDVLVMERAGGAIWENDAIEIWLDGKQFGASVSVDDGLPFVTDWMGVGSTTKAAFAKTAKGWIMEASISLAELRDAGVDVVKGNSVQLALGLDDADTPGGGFEGHLYFPLSWAWGNPASFATATFK